MAYDVISDFRAGLDRRRSILTSPPGTLWTGTNVHITRGGEIEKRMAFVPVLTVPSNSFGLASNNINLYIFGPGPAPSVPSPFIYQVLTHPTGLAMTGVVATTMFRGLPYVLASFADRSVQHFYNGTIVAAWAPGGTYAANPPARAVATIGSKVYAVSGNSLYFCEGLTPANWGTNVNGAGNIDMTTNSSGPDMLTGLSVYLDRLVVLSSRTAQVWVVDPDPSKYYQTQVMPNLGTVAGNSIVRYGDTDNFMLAQTGIRSLRARDISNVAGSYDIGTPIDTIVNPLVGALDAATIAAAAGVLEPIDGRYLLALGTTILVFSYFPTGQISAWTEYTVPGQITAWGVIARKLYARSGNSILLYGGADGATYDTSLADVVLPYLDAKSPSTYKQFTGFDAALTGRWDVEVGMDPSPPYVREMVARLDHETFGMGRIDAVGRGTHFGVRLTSRSPAAAGISNIVLHYEAYDDKSG
jgi:hypothetical protein